MLWERLSRPLLKPEVASSGLGMCDRAMNCRTWSLSLNLSNATQIGTSVAMFN